MSHHFFTTRIDGETIELAGDEGRHAARVLRIRTGEEISVADGTGAVYRAVVRDPSDTVTAEVLDAVHHDRPRPEITLFQALAKGQRLEDCVTKAVEVGVARIVPFAAERSVVRWDARKQRQQRERWEAVALAAAKQCRSPWLTEMGEVIDGVGGICASHAIALDAASTTPLRDVLPDVPPPTMALVVGPEGGLTASELDALCRKGAAVATLGPRILRTETAGPVTAALVGYAYGVIG